MRKIINKIIRRLMRLRLKPIRVLVFHQVSEKFDPNVSWKCDWTDIEQFKQKISSLQEEYTFVSLSDAYKHLQHDVFRRKKYAVLTNDDGWASLPEIIPWLGEQNIPVTLFLNPAYLKKEEIRENGMNYLLSVEQLRDLLEANPSITIASHGWNHTNCAEQNKETFIKNVVDSTRYLQKEKNYTPFFAYPFGIHEEWHDDYLIKQHIVPVYCDGGKNYNDKNVIHRECIDGEKMCYDK